MYMALASDEKLTIERPETEAGAACEWFGSRTLQCSSSLSTSSLRKLIFGADWQGSREEVTVERYEPRGIF